MRCCRLTHNKNTKYYGPDCLKKDENSSNFCNQTAAEYNKIHVMFCIFCQDVLFWVTLLETDYFFHCAINQDDF